MYFLEYSKRSLRLEWNREKGGTNNCYKKSLFERRGATYMSLSPAEMYITLSKENVHTIF